MISLNVSIDHSIEGQCSMEYPIVGEGEHVRMIRPYDSTKRYIERGGGGILRMNLSSAPSGVMEHVSSGVMFERSHQIMHEMFEEGDL